MNDCCINSNTYLETLTRFAVFAKSKFGLHCVKAEFHEPEIWKSAQGNIWLQSILLKSGISERPNHSPIDVVFSDLCEGAGKFGEFHDILIKSSSLTKLLRKNSDSMILERIVRVIAGVCAYHIGKLESLGSAARNFSSKYLPSEIEKYLIESNLLWIKELWNSCDIVGFMQK
jgi:hypothetical protein